MCFATRVQGRAGGGDLRARVGVRGTVGCGKGYRWRRPVDRQQREVGVHVEKKMVE